MIGAGPIAFQGIAWLRGFILPEAVAVDPRTFTADGGIGATFAADGGIGATFTATGSEEGVTPTNNFTFDTNEDVEIVLTIPTTDDISGWAVDLVMERADDGTVVSGASASVTDAAEKEITGEVPADTLDPGEYRYAIRRTDTGSKKTLSRGVLYALDPIGE